MPALSHAEFLAQKRFPAFDGLRAVATLLVLCFHFGGPSCKWLSGWIGVHIFFVLSGFLITTLALREEARDGRLSLIDFYIRRFFRIVPAYAVVLLVTVVFARINGGRNFERVMAALPYYATFLNDFAPRASFEISWTIAIEQKFYLIWPLIAFAAGRFVRPFRLWLALGVLVAAASVTFAASISWMVHYVVILEGCLLAILMHGPRGFALVRFLTAPLVSVPVAAAFIAVHLLVPRGVAGFGEPPVIAVYGLAVALLLPTIITRSPTRFLLSTRPLVAIGQRSYSLYLIQMTASAAVAGLLPGLPRGTLPYLAAVALMALGFADLIYRWVEVPLIALGRRIVERRRARTLVVSSLAL